MSKPRTPILNKLYQQYLADEQAAKFIKAIAQRYTAQTLERLTERGSRITRRAAVLALGYVGGYSSNGVLGRALHDRDRAVRVLAENGIRELWRRDGNEFQQQRLNELMRLNYAGQFRDAILAAAELIHDAPWFAEAWNQRAIAFYYLKKYEDSANDCQQTLELNPHHFGAAIGMAHCYIEMDDVLGALQSLRRALKLNPGLEGVRAQVAYLQRSLEGR